MPHPARYGALTAVVVALSALFLQCGHETFDSQDSDSGEDAASDGAVTDSPLSDAIVSNDGGSADGAFLFDDPCATGSPHALCCDFDDDGGIPSCFPTQQALQGTLSIASDGLATSLPHSLHSVANGDAGYAYGRKTLAATVATTCTFDLYIDKLNGFGHNIFAISVNGNDNQGITSVIDVDGDGGLAMLRVFGPMVSGPGFTTGKLELPFRQWVRIQMGLTLPAVGTASGSVSALSLDAGAPVAIVTNIASISQFGLAVGFDYVGYGNGEAHIDNLVCDAH